MLILSGPDRSKPRRATTHRVPTLDARLTCPENEAQQSNWLRREAHTTVRRSDRCRMSRSIERLTEDFRVSNETEGRTSAAASDRRFGYCLTATGDRRRGAADRRAGDI